jgi:hypothetical protein
MSMSRKDLERRLNKEIDVDNGPVCCSLNDSLLDVPTQSQACMAIG